LSVPLCNRYLPGPLDRRESRTPKGEADAYADSRKPRLCDCPRLSFSAAPRPLDKLTVCLA
jgi:hypothetical protein